MGFNPFEEFKELIEGGADEIHEFLQDTGQELEEFFGVDNKPESVPELKADIPTPGDSEVEEARRAQRRRYGRAATLLTGGQGLTDPAPTARRTLLGN